MRFPGPAFGEVLTPAARSWADRTGAKLEIADTPMTPGDDADIGVIAAAEFGAWAERGELAPVPASLRASEHPFQWMNVLPPYREQLIEWGGQALAVPLAGDGFVILYRADRLTDARFVAEFQAQFQRPPAPPATWDDFAALATVFTALDHKPAVAPLTEAELASLFFRIAACHDRVAGPEVNKAAAPGDSLDRLSFQFDLAGGEPRLGNPAFAAAASWFARLAAAKALPPPAPGAESDPGAAFARGDASLAVVSLAHLARVPREAGAVPGRYALAALPGARTAYDREKKKLVPLSGPNYVPYFAGGRLGVVRARCRHPAAAFDLLADLGGPTRSLETIASAELGAGPFRVTHLDRDHQYIWYGYGFDAARTDQLRTALMNYVQVDAKNPTYGLRGPDQAALSAAAAGVMAKIAGGLPANGGIKLMAEEWKAIDQKTPADVRLSWRKKAAGVN